MGGIDDVEFTRDAIVFRGYPFPGARVYPHGSVAWSQVVEADPHASPPELRVPGETLFVDARRRDELRAAAQAHGVPLVRRVDVWHLLLEEYLDTEFTPEQQERTLEFLEQNGISRDETAAIRGRVGRKVMAVNARAWEWVHLGMWDLFHIFNPHPFSRLLGAETRFRELYAWAQEIAQRAGVLYTAADPATDAADTAASESSPES